MPRNGKEGILFSFIMSALMIYVMAALNMYVRAFLGLGGLTLTSSYEPFVYAVLNFPLAYLVGMICDLGVCTPLSRRIMQGICADTDRAAFKGFVVKFCMVIFMTIAMTIFGAIAAVGVSPYAIAAFFTLFPYNFVLALPIQMLGAAPLAGRIVHAIGDRAQWNRRAPVPGIPKSIGAAADVMQEDVYTVSADATVADAMREIIRRNVSGLPVVDNANRIAGFISESDILRELAYGDAPVSDYSTLVSGLAKNELPGADFDTLLTKNVMEIAARDVVSVSPDTDIETLSQLFGYRRLKKVPVVNEGRLVGIVNRSRLMRRAMEGYVAGAGSH